MPDLLVELLSEEIPARMQQKASLDLEKLFTDGISELGLTYKSSAAFSTPRRLTLVLENVASTSLSRVEEKKGPRKGAPDKAIQGFLKNTGLEFSQLEVRQEKMLTSTTELADLVSECVPTREPGKHPATRTFQAFRIYINREMEELDAVLPQALEVLNPGGRLAVISFHSLEDRKVKNFFRKEFKGDPFPIDLPVTKYDLHPGIETIERPTRPSEIEVNQNPRARSAVLRSAQKSAGESV